MIATSLKRRFKPVRCLGEGAMGVVYEAIDIEHGTRVALKTLRHMTAESLARLKREFRAMQDVHHENLVSLGELVSEGDEWFFTMELVDGVDWLEHVRGSPSQGHLDLSLTASLPRAGSVPPASSVPPPRPVADAPSFDETRLRSALRQLAEALGALHAAGLVHRDVKSSNVRVTREGRVVLLDFGLVDSSGSTPGWTRDAAGTPAYMAPEQVAAARVGPEADWYAFGALLFEALTGKLPFEGSALQVMMRKQQEQPPAPSALVPTLPKDLDALCAGLLSFDPSARPRGSEVLRVLGAPSASASATGSQTQTGAFVGRRAELESLMAAFHRARGGSAVPFVVEGESGVGKSTLVRRFVQQLGVEWPEAVVLAGRCYERESVPFKAFDGVVDALARVLVRMGDEGATMVPTRVAPIVQVFPVLRRVAAIAAQTRGRQPEVPPFELRERAFASLRELFTRLADRRPLVVIIDDAQWGDVDSLDLLTDLLRPPDAPGLMLVLTVRTGVGAVPSTKRHGRILSDTLQGQVRRIQLGPLPEEDATTLATQLLERSGVNNPRLALWSVQQTGGHPLFIDMIMRRADTFSPSGDIELQLEEVLWGIIQELDATPRAVLESVAVAAAPLAQDVVRRAASLSADTFAKAVSLLRVSHLVQTGGARASDRLEPYHDRVRAAVLAHLDEARRAECHRRIAVALETSGHPDAEALSLHWQGAGDAQQAAHYAALAGDRAGEALAFDQAAGSYELALTKGEWVPVERRALLVKLAKVLESAGRGEKAAQAYLEAAEGAPALQRTELERAASVELLSSGRLAEGAAVLHRVLGGVGFRAPRTTLGALFWLIVYSVWVRVRGLGFKERSPDEVRREDRSRIDALFAASMGFGLSDVIMSQCIMVRHLIAALRAGDRFQMLRATSLISISLASRGARGRFEQAITAVGTRLAQREESAEGKAFFDECRGVGLYSRGRWKEALAALDRSLSRVQKHDHRAGWQSNAHLVGCWALRFMGEHAELARRHARLSADAERRGDLYTSVQLRDGSLVVVWLAHDQPREARRHIRESIAQWPSSRYLLQHWHAMSGEAEIALYVGDGARAYARLEQDGAALGKSLFLKVQLVRATTAFLRGRAAIASIDAEPALRAARLAETRKLAQKLDKENMGWTAPLAASLRAGVASVDGDRTGAIALLRSAIELSERADMSGCANAARHQLGLLIGGAEGQALVRQAEEAMAAQGIRVPARFAQMGVPGRWTGEPPPEAAASRIPS
jgi:Cdc6-like AAA superfamily ATPase